MPSAFDLIDADAATAIYDAFAVSAVYWHWETAQSETVAIVDFPDVQQVPAGFDGYAIVKRHEITVQHADLSIPPAVRDTVTFDGATYRIDEIVSDDEIEIRAVVVEVQIDSA